jgi:hypothetical protein
VRRIWHWSSENLFGAVKEICIWIAFLKAKAPEWVLEELQNLQPSAIRFEIDEDEIVKAVVTVDEKMIFQSV